MRGGGITLLDITNPSAPKVFQRWNRVNVDMEGQDRSGNIFITIARRGELFIYKVFKNKKIYMIARLKLPAIDVHAPVAFAIPALHTRIYKKGKNLYAMITCPWSKKLMAVDITDAYKPKFVSAINTKIKGIEGIQIYKDHAYVGGFRSNHYKVYDISNPSKMRLVQTLKNKSFSQMVPEMSPDYPNRLFVALWGDPGGVASFDLTEPSKIHVHNMVTDSSMAKANRVKIKNDLILLPLEQKVGGIGIVKIRKFPPGLIKQVTMTNIPEVIKPYTLNFKDDYIYLFGSESKSMAILKFIKY